VGRGTDTLFYVLRTEATRVGTWDRVFRAGFSLLSADRAENTVILQMTPTRVVLSMGLLVPKFFCRLDFWGAALDIVGLMVLLSYDLSFLRPWLMRYPCLRLRHGVLIRVSQACNQFENSYPPAGVPRILMSLSNDEAPLFVNLFDDFDASQMPQSIVVYVSLGDQFTRRPWVGPGIRVPAPAPAGPFGPDPIQSLASPLHIPELFKQEERSIQRVVYGLGFLLMVLGSVLSMIQIALGK